MNSKSLKSTQLLRYQLSKFPHQTVTGSLPKRGWIETLRLALGMSQVDLARRMKIKPQTVAQMEDSERKGTISINTLKKAAENLNCQLIYSINPQKKLEEIIREQALKMADDLLRRNQTHMELEQQGTNEDFRIMQKEQIAEDLMRNPRKLWSIS